ncbi:MAG TPA: S41 family peptidase [Pyrinomonadaceae bacterium]|nr:PDZ domain-containing protein [Acidobacteriota bacterium]HQZ96271.1 S41 family peptidase [Pyrinomonadaceae bacterium]
MFKLSVTHKIIVSLLFLLSIPLGITAQSYDRIERSRMSAILDVVKDTVKKNYYDETFRGIDLDARFKKAEERLGQVNSTPAALAVIAQVLVDFNDSHLFFIPPSTDLAVEYGWRMKAIGNDVFITAVKPGSDAEKKGVKVGDQILSVGGFRPTKSELWKVQYFYNGISKRDHLVLKLLSPGVEAPRDVDVMSEMKRTPRNITAQSFFRLFDDFYEPENNKHRFYTFDGVALWKMPGFDFEEGQVDQLMDRVKNSRSLIIDMRGNGGGYIKTLERLTGFFLDKDVKIADLKGRKSMDPIFAKTRGKDVYNGRLVVLVDSASGSAAEMFARLIQLEKRGKVVGDVSAGAVMQSRSFDQQVGVSGIVLFGVSVTNADVFMSDGKSLEHIGVQPDEVIRPTGEDLAKQRDPALAKAVELLGGNLSAETAGKLNVYYWKKN